MPSFPTLPRSCMETHTGLKQYENNFGTIDFFIKNIHRLSLSILAGRRASGICIFTLERGNEGMLRFFGILERYPFLDVKNWVNEQFGGA